MTSESTFLSSHLLQKLVEMAEEHERLTEKSSDLELMKNPTQMTKLLRELGALGKTVDLYNEYKSLEETEAEARQILESGEEDDLKALAQEELEECALKREKCSLALKEQLISTPEDNTHKAIVEVRPGTGGDEAGLFAADLYRMYEKYAEIRGWSVEIMDSHPTEIGGFKEMIFSISGQDVFRFMKYESGTHRVQRVPKTETSGRIHTSAATVAVLPEVEAVEIDIKTSDLRVDTFRSSGPGGQSVNKTSSAVRMTHIPTGIVVSMQDEKSQHKNRAKALRLMRSRVYAKFTEEEREKRDSTRRNQIGTGDRSQRIRTYNFPQNRVTDHRIGLTLHSLGGIMEGDLDELLMALDEANKEELIKQL